MTNTPVIFGEVLFDCFADGREVLGGAPFNVAWNLQAFGMAPLLISRIGDDLHGRKILAAMNSWGMDTSHVQIDPALPTGRVRILLKEGEPQFEILAGQAYDFITDTPLTGKKPAFLYHGSLALRNPLSRRSLDKLKKRCPCPVFIDLNLRSPWWQKDLITDILADADWLKLNEDELRTVSPAGHDLKGRVLKLFEQYELEAVFITRGSKGAAAWKTGGEFRLVIPPAAVSVADTVGAGDAFSSVLLLGLSAGWPLQTMLDRAQQFASAVVTLQGATTTDPSFYQPFCQQWDLL